MLLTLHAYSLPSTNALAHIQVVQPFFAAVSSVDVDILLTKHLPSALPRLTAKEKYDAVLAACKGRRMDSARKLLELLPDNDKVRSFKELLGLASASSAACLYSPTEIEDLLRWGYDEDFWQPDDLQESALAASARGDVPMLGALLPKVKEQSSLHAIALAAVKKKHLETVLAVMVRDYGLAVEGPSGQALVTAVWDASLAADAQLALLSSLQQLGCDMKHAVELAKKADKKLLANKIAKLAEQGVPKVSTRDASGSTRGSVSNKGATGPPRSPEAAFNRVGTLGSDEIEVRTSRLGSKGAVKSIYEVFRATTDSRYAGIAVAPKSQPELDYELEIMQILRDPNRLASDKTGNLLKLQFLVNPPARCPGFDEDDKDAPMLQALVHPLASKDLYQAIVDSKVGIEKYAAWRILNDVCQALLALHCYCKPVIVHRDVKSPNVLLVFANQRQQADDLRTVSAVLADFGSSTPLDYKTFRPPPPGPTGTPIRSPPEVVLSSVKEGQVASLPAASPSPSGAARRPSLTRSGSKTGSGSSRSVVQKQGSSHSLKVAPADNLSVTPAIDIWSVGCIIMELFLEPEGGEPASPYPGVTNNFLDVFAAMYPGVNSLEGVSAKSAKAPMGAHKIPNKEARELAILCLHPDPGKRPGIKQLAGRVRDEFEKVLPGHGLATREHAKTEALKEVALNINLLRSDVKQGFVDLKRFVYDNDVATMPRLLYFMPEAIARAQFQPDREVCTLKTGASSSSKRTRTQDHAPEHKQTHSKH
jgi:serine/threonine protein kinase